MIDKRAEVRNPQLLRMAPVEAVQHKAARIGMGWWQFQQLGLYPHILAEVNSAERARGGVCGVANLSALAKPAARSDLTPLRYSLTASWRLRP